jgi:hypothetical protein
MSGAAVAAAAAAAAAVAVRERAELVALLAAAGEGATGAHPGGGRALDITATMRRVRMEDLDEVAIGGWRC